MQLLLIYFFLVCTLLVFILKITRAGNISKRPPGPWKLPLIGHLHHLRGLPHHSLCDLAKRHGPLMLLRLGEMDTVIVSSPRVAEEVMKTQDLTFANRPSLLAAGIFSYNNVSITFSPYGDYWRQLRKICVIELLSVKKVQSLWSIREEEVSTFIRDISTGSPINLSEKLATLTSDIVSRAAFGKKFKDKERLVLLVKEASSIAGGFDFTDLFPSLKYLHWMSGAKSNLERVQRKVDAILEDIVNEHRANRTRLSTNKLEHEEDIVDVFLRLHEEDNLSIPLENNNIKAVLLDVFGAGSETTSTTLVWAMSELMQNPKVLVKTQDEVRRVLNGKTKICQLDMNQLNYLKLVVKETMRLHPAAALLLPRESRERCEVERYEISKGTKVIVNAWALGRDPDFWRNAEKFEPERFQDLSIDYNGNNFSFVPFGSGRRLCPGISFSVATMELTLAMLLYHFDWKIPGDNELDMSESFGMTMNKKFPLILVPIAVCQVGRRNQ